MPNVNHDLALLTAKLARHALAKELAPNWGRCVHQGRQLVFSRNVPPVFVFVVFSKLNETNSQWWYDLPPRRWHGQYLAVIMKEDSEFNYILLHPDEAQQLHDRSRGKANKPRKFHVIRPSQGELYFIEWPDLSLRTRAKLLHVDPLDMAAL